MKKSLKKIKELVFMLPTVFVFVAVLFGTINNKQVYKSLDKFISPETIKADEAGEEDNKNTNINISDNEEIIKEDEKESETIESKDGYWADGTYQGSAKGFGGDITVEVTIKNEKITAIKIISSDDETPEYFDMAKAIIESILKSQSVDVDTVSGATYSSNGIRNAVIDALNKAVKDPDRIIEKSVTLKEKENKDIQKKTKKKSKNKSNKGPKDGVYQVSEVCDRFLYTMSFKVKFKNGKCVAIYGLKVTDNDDSENENYYKKAWKDMVKKILKAQDSDVDVTSGATYSANAIINGYIDAYNKAVKANGNSSEKNSKKQKKSSNNKKSNEDENENLDDAEEKIEELSGVPKDGTYNVSTICSPDSYEAFKAYTMYADVTFKDGKLVSIDNFSSDDESNRKYYEKAANGKGKIIGVVDQLISKQSADGISAVSGATCSSKAIRKLYIIAFNEAAGSSLDVDDELSDETESKEDAEEEITTEPDEENVEDESIVYKDCVIDVTDTVWPDDGEDFEEYDMTARFTFAEGRISDISIVSSMDNINLYYCERALNGADKFTGMLSQFKELMSTKKVDTVSGATCSSEAFIRMFDKALSEAKE